MAKLSTPNFDEAIEIWIRRWRKTKNVRITTEFDCDPRRLYEIYYEQAHKGSREKALDRLRLEDPKLAALAESGVLDPKPKYVKQQGSSQGDFFA